MKTMLAAVATLLVSASIPVMATDAATAAEPIVTFPALTRWNPADQDYVIRVDDAGGDGVLKVARLGTEPMVEIPHEGDVAIEFPNDGPTAVVVYRCATTADTYCSQVARSPSLYPYRSIYVSALWDTVGPVDAFGGPERLPVQFSVWPSDETPPTEFELTWSLVAAGSPTPLAEGKLTLKDSDYFTLAVPDGLANGVSYYLRQDVSATVTDYGPLTGSRVQAVRYDDQAPAVPVTITRQDWYPENDGYLDDNEVRAKLTERVFRRGYEVLDATGKVVASAVQNDLYDGTKILKYGIPGKIPAGRYRVRLFGVDLAGNRGVGYSPWFTKHDEKIQDVRWRHRFRAGATMVDKLVGRCSTLAKPGTHGWKGSIGLLSQTRCRVPSQSVVATLHVLPLPRTTKAARFRGPVEVRLYGGAARGARRPYLVGFLIDVDGKIPPYGRHVLPGKVGRHVIGSARSARKVIHVDAKGRAYLLAQIGLTAGSRYDVADFRVDITYKDLVKTVRPRATAADAPPVRGVDGPSGSWTWVTTGA
jgi:hypothetical protein